MIPSIDRRGRKSPVGPSTCACRNVLRLIALLATSALSSGQVANRAEIEQFQDLRERLTEREDENRVKEPRMVRFLGRPLSLNGQYEISLEQTGRLALGDGTGRHGRLLLEQEIETEAFYGINGGLSFFAQLRMPQAEDLDAATPDGVSDIFVERGEMWVNVQNIAGLPLGLEAGRLDFEDDRLWWWDEDLDALRVTCEAGPLEATFAAARELASDRSGRSSVNPDENGVVRLIAEASWDWRPNHSIQFFALAHHDRSRTEAPGETFAREREDESDAKLAWLGVRASGAGDLGAGGIVGYWLDAGWVRGDERLIEADGVAPGISEVEEVITRKVRGRAFDVGVTWMLRGAAEPRLTLAYARGSGDRKPDDAIDRTYHQTGLHANEPGFGGVQRFQGYGELLDPELSNLGIFTAGIGCSLFAASSVDLIYHHYRLVEPAESLRDARIDAELTGAHRDLGHGVDLVLAFEEWERIELEFAVSTFRAGKAFGGDKGKWLVGGFAAFRFAF